jgi:hypothetical protein
MHYQWRTPLDPDCPGARAIDRALDDPITVVYGIGDELGPDLERRHLTECERCQRYGAANVEVVGP